jgi:tRNA dimethylallyltransferase
MKVKNSRVTPVLIVLIGPTAVGKTDLSLKLGECLQAEIISADSRLFYRGLDIGTAKPTLEEQSTVPHHLIDVVTPDQSWSLAIYQSEARKVVEEIQRRASIPILVGGTGQYIYAVIEGWQVPPGSVDEDYREQLRQFVENEGADALHRRLETVDPGSAARIDYRNIRRVIRALEIFHLTGRTATELRQKEPLPFPLLKIGLTLPRAVLYERIDRRLEKMLDAGWEAEVRDLLSQGYDFNAPAFSAIGYRQIASVVKGEIKLEEAKAQIRRLLRQLVRRQANWFKESDPTIHWFTNDEHAPDEVKRLINQWMADKGLEEFKINT